MWKWDTHPIVGPQVQARNEFTAVTDLVFIQPTCYRVQLIDQLLPPRVQDHEGKHHREMRFKSLKASFGKQNEHYFCRSSAFLMWNSCIRWVTFSTSFSLRLSLPLREFALSLPSYWSNGLSSSPENQACFRSTLQAAFSKPPWPLHRVLSQIGKPQITCKSPHHIYTWEKTRTSVRDPSSWIMKRVQDK